MSTSEIDAIESLNNLKELTEFLLEKLRGERADMKKLSGPNHLKEEGDRGLEFILAIQSKFGERGLEIYQVCCHSINHNCDGEDILIGDETE